MLRGIYEFRGYEEKTGKNGKNFCYLNMEDCENGQAVRFFVPANIFEHLYNDVKSLQKGDFAEVVLNFHLNYGEWKADFVDFIKESNE